MRTPLLVECFSRLPHRLRHAASPAPGRFDPERGEGETRAGRSRTSEPPRGSTALETFRQKVTEKYTEGTLLRLLHSTDARVRRASTFALGLLGTMEESNASLAACLHDEDAETQRLAAGSLWSLWFRADSSENGEELRKLVKMRDRAQALVGLGKLIAKTPLFAEAYNQRGILYFQGREFDKALADCERTLELNPHHFGAQAGLGQCYLQMRKHRSALKAFRTALRINPRLESVAATVRALEKALGEEGR